MSVHVSVTSSPGISSPPAIICSRTTPSTHLSLSTARFAAHWVWPVCVCVCV